MKRPARNLKQGVVASPKATEAFETNALIRVLNAAYLGGAIDEFVLNIKDGVGTIAAVDKTNCVFALSQGPVGQIGDATIGLKEVGFFIKAVAAAGTEKIDYVVEDNRWFKIKMQGAGEVKILLSDPKMIPTNIDDWETPVAGMQEAVAFEFTLEKDYVEKFLYFQDLVKNTTTLVMVEGGRVFIGSGRFETRTFKIDTGIDLESEDFVVGVYGDFMKAILQEIDWAKGAGDPVMFIGAGAPVLVKQGDRFWSLSPSVEGGNV